MHKSAFGIEIEKKQLPKIIEKCNKDLPLSDLCTIFEVDYKIDAKILTALDVSAVAENYKIWGNNVKEPVFYISNLEINADEITAYGENKGFIRFVYNNIPFIKKYAPYGMFEEMTMRSRHTLGKNTKRLKLNIIGNFILNEYNGNLIPQVKIQEFDVEEIKDFVVEIKDQTIYNDKKEKNVGLQQINSKKVNEDFVWAMNEKTTEKEVKKKKVVEIDDDFVF